MPFDPSQPFTVLEADPRKKKSSGFDPSQPFEVLDREPDLTPEPEEVGTLKGISESARQALIAAMQAEEFRRALGGPEQIAEVQARMEQMGERTAPQLQERRAAQLAALQEMQEERPPRIAEREQKLRQIRLSPAMERWNQAEGMDAVKAFASDPVEITANIVASGFASSLPGMAYGIAGSALAGPAGMAGGTGAGSLQVEYASTIVESFREAGYDLTNPEQVMKAAQDTEAIERAKAKALKKAVPVAVFDAATAGLAGKFLKGAKGTASTIKRSGAELGMQASGGAAGEAAGQLVSEGRIESGKAIFEEAIGELGTGPSEVVSNLRTERKQRRQEEEREAIKKLVEAMRKAQEKAQAQQAETPAPSSEPVTSLEDLLPESAQERAAAIEQEQERQQDPEEQERRMRAQLEVDILKRRGMPETEARGLASDLRSKLVNMTPEEFTGWQTQQAERREQSQRETEEANRRMREERARQQRERPAWEKTRHEYEGTLEEQWAEVLAEYERGELSPADVRDRGLRRRLQNLERKKEQERDPWAEWEALTPEEQEQRIRQEEQAAVEADLEDSTDLRDALRQVKLPHPEAARRANDPMAGELQDIYNDLNFGERNALFSPKGQTKSLDNLRETLNSDYGFDFQTPDDLLQAIDQMQRGQKVYAQRASRRKRGRKDGTPERAAVLRGITPMLKRWTSRPRIFVYPSLKELPAQFQGLRDIDNVEGFYDPDSNSVHIIANQVRPDPGQSLEARAQQVILHEVLGHFDLKELLGKRYGEWMDRIVARMGHTAAAREIIELYGLDPTIEQHRHVLGEELLARMAENYQLRINFQTLWSEFVAMFRQILRHLGFSLEVTDNDLQRLLRRKDRRLRWTGTGVPNSRVGTTRSPMPAAASQRFLYAGRNAEGFDRAEREGRTFEGKYDGETRFEIDDSGTWWQGLGKAATIGEALQGRENLTVGDVFNHPRLYENYAWTADIPLEVRPTPGNRGTYYPDSRRIVLHSDQSQAEARKALLHELQHAIQEEERFARGSSPVEYAREGSQFPEDDYTNTAGEIEARDVSARSELGEAARRQIAPYSSEAIDPSEANVRFSRRDADYMQAVERGDMEAAQRMVDDAARTAGYTIEGWHSTRDGWTFTEFKTDQEAGAHFGSTRAQADMRGKRANTRRFYLRMESPARVRDRGQFKAIPKGRDSIIYLNRFEGISLETVESIPASQLDAMTDAQFRRAVPEAGESFAVRSAWQIKSADPVTRDDAGNVIPISRRFDDQQSDFRFSRRREQGPDLIRDQTEMFDVEETPFNLTGETQQDTEGQTRRNLERAGQEDPQQELFFSRRQAREVIKTPTQAEIAKLEQEASLLFKYDPDRRNIPGGTLPNGPLEKRRGEQAGAPQRTLAELEQLILRGIFNRDRAVDAVNRYLLALRAGDKQTRQYAQDRAPGGSRFKAGPTEDAAIVAYQESGIRSAAHAQQVLAAIRRFNEGGQFSQTVADSIKAYVPFSYGIRASMRERTRSLPEVIEAAKARMAKLDAEIEEMQKVVASSKGPAKQLANQRLKELLGQRAVTRSEIADMELLGAMPIEEAPTESALDRHDRVKTATFQEGGWWTRIKEFFAKGFHGFRLVPELPGTTQFTRFRDAYTHLRGSPARIRHEATRIVEHILEPITKLGRPAIAANDIALYRRLRQTRDEQLQENGAVNPKLQEKLERVRAKVEASPYHLFRELVLYQDLLHRSQMLNKHGQPITLPDNLTAEEVLAERNRLLELLNAHPDREAITDSLKRHYAQMEEEKKVLEKYGYIIPVELNNPYYYPHMVLDYWTGRTDKPRFIRDKPFRGYLEELIGTSKDIESDYLKAVYSHIYAVRLHNAQQDMVEQGIKPYDQTQNVLRRLQEAADEEAEAYGRKPRKVDKSEAFLPWNLPDGHVVLELDERLPLRPEEMLDRQLLGQALGVALKADSSLAAQLRELGADVRLTAEMLKQAWVVADKQKLIVPEEVAAAVRGILYRESQRDGGFKRALGKLNSWWKWTKLFLPWNYIRYEYGNTLTDIEKVLSGDPKVFTLLPQAFKEVRAFFKDGTASEDLKQAVKFGVLESVTANEVNALPEQREFEHFMTSKERLWSHLRSLGKVTTAASRIREATFRYAKYLSALEAYRNGAYPKFQGAWMQDVEATQDSQPGANDAMFRKAAKIASRTFGNYGEISVAGDAMRRHWVPFYSWIEINFKYHRDLIRNFRDLVKMGDMSKGEAAAGSARAASVLAAGFVARLALPYLAVWLWNNSGDREELEETLSEHDRRRFHIILGRDDEGKTIVVYTPTALGDIMEWFGGGEMMRQAGDMARGEVTFSQAFGGWAKQLPPDLLNKVVSSIGPLAKVPYVAASKKNPFPDVTDQRTISDHDLKWAILDNMGDQFTGWMIRRAVDKDYYSARDLGDWAQQLILQQRKRDPEAWSYYSTRDRADKFMEQHGGTMEPGVNNRENAQVLRNFRRSIYEGDVQAAIHNYHRLLEFGYTAEQLRSSIRGQDPLGAVPKRDGLRRQFYASLSPAEQREVLRAYQFYARMAAQKGRETDLFPRAREGQTGMDRMRRRPADQQLRNMVRQRNTLTDRQSEAQARRLLEEALR